MREPAVVVRRTALEQEGLFDTSVGGATDTDMWVRLFSRYGVRCLPQATCAYTIHEAAATTGMWNPGTIRANGEIFDRAVARGVVPEPTIRRWQADWYHQFILAGAYRRLRLGDGPRRARCCDCLTCPRSVTWACHRNGCRYAWHSRLQLQALALASSPTCNAVSAAKNPQHQEETVLRGPPLDDAECAVLTAGRRQRHEEIAMRVWCGDRG